MPRQLKPQKIDVMTDHKKNVTVVLYLDRNDMVFFAQLTPAHPKLEAKEYDKLRCLVLKALEEYQPYVWRQEIWVQPYEVHGNLRPGGRRFANSHSSRVDDPPNLDWPVVGLFFDRHEVADISNAEGRRYDMVERDFREPGHEETERQKEGRDIEADYHPAKSKVRDPHVRVFPYSEELWESLKRLEARILAARRQLFELLGRDDLAAVLLQLPATPGAPLLGRGLVEAEQHSPSPTSPSGPPRRRRASTDS